MLTTKDTNPPAGAGLTTTAVVLLQLHHHDRASLLAGKLHAVLNTKERDFFDLLQRPRLVITQSHAAQPCACTSRPARPMPTGENRRAVLHERLIMAEGGG